MKFAVVGEGVVDRFIVDTLSTDVIGGSGLNTALAAKLAGLDVVWYANSGNDDLGVAISEFARTAGILRPTLRILDYPSPLVEIRLDREGSPNYTFSIHNTVDWQWTDLQLEGLLEYDVFHLTSLSGVLQPGSDAIVRFLKSKPEGLLTTYDPNARPSALQSKDHEFARSRIEEIVSLVDIVKVSDEDLEWITPNSIDDTAIRWSRTGPRFVVLTRGKDGVTLYCDGKESAHCDGVPVDVIDTVGAGDTIMAWTLASLESADGIPTPNQLATDLELAVKAAAITCTRQGCKPPTRLEVLER